MRPSLVRATVVAAALALLGTTTLVGGAEGAAPGDPARTTLLRHLDGPLSLAVTAKGGLLVTENSSATLVRRTTGAPTRILLGGKDDEIAGVSVTRTDVYVARTGSRGTGVVRASLTGGRFKVVGDTAAYEADHNPNADVVYGFRDLDDPCLAAFPEGVSATHTGDVESHPYGTAVRGETTYVADAGANAILAIKDHQVSTVAVVPAVPVEITSDMALALTMPDCVVGHTYWLEPVPTDVEVGPDGDLYVSSLPGGPEDGTTLGALGQVVRIDASSGDSTVIATGFRGATGLAVAKNEDVYVAELFGQRISRVPAGSDVPEKFASVSQPAAVEVVGQQLYATVDVFEGGADYTGGGRVVRFGL